MGEWSPSLQPLRFSATGWVSGSCHPLHGSKLFQPPQGTTYLKGECSLRSSLLTDQVSGMGSLQAVESIAQVTHTIPPSLSWGRELRQLSRRESPGLLKQPWASHARSQIVSWGSLHWELSTPEGRLGMPGRGSSLHTTVGFVGDGLPLPLQHAHSEQWVGVKVTRHWRH